MTGSCNSMAPYQAFIVGIMASICYIKVSRLIGEYYKIDDPLDASTIHGACGILGTLCVAIFGKDDKGVNFNSSWNKLFYQLLIQAVGCLAIICWSAFWSFLFFSISKHYKVLRYRQHEELIGGDLLNFRTKPQYDDQQQHYYQAL